jgi:hypothetical protein
MWCHAANRLETHLDAHRYGGPGWTDLTCGLGDIPELCAIAGRYLELDTPVVHPPDWADVAGRAQEIHDRLDLDWARQAPQRQIERGSTLELGW